MREYSLRIETPLGTAPSLVMSPEDISRGTVLVYHGLAAEKEVQRKEMTWLAEAGFTAVGVDALHHGERSDGFLEELERADEPDAHYRVMSLVRDSASEIPAILDECSKRFPGGIGITGISLGGFISYAAAPADRRIRAAVPILGSPSWSAKQNGSHPQLQALLAEAPACFPEKFPPCALLAANATRDIYVSPEGSRNFIQRLEQEYRAIPEKLLYLEYAESGHFMREEDWNDLWSHVVRWFHYHL